MPWVRVSPCARVLDGVVGDSAGVRGDALTFPVMLVTVTLLDRVHSCRNYLAVKSTPSSFHWFDRAQLPWQIECQCRLPGDISERRTTPRLRMVIIYSIVSHSPGIGQLVLSSQNSTTSVTSPPVYGNQLARVDCNGVTDRVRLLPSPRRQLVADVVALHVRLPSTCIGAPALGWRIQFSTIHRAVVYRCLEFKIVIARLL